MQITEILQKINELLRKEMESGEKVDAKDFPEAIQKIYDLYKQGKLNVYCPDVFEFKYTGDSYQLCAVSGKKNKKGKVTYGLAHILDKHVGEIVNGRKVTEEQLVRAMQRTQDVLEEALEKEKVYYNAFYNRILVEKDNYYYIISLPKNDKEVCFLTTLFKSDPNYIKRLLRKYDYIRR